MATEAQGTHNVVPDTEDSCGLTLPHQNDLIWASTKMIAKPSLFTKRELQCSLFLTEKSLTKVLQLVCEKEID